MSPTLTLCSELERQEQMIVIGSKSQLLQSKLAEKIGIDSKMWLDILKNLTARDAPRTTRIWAGKNQVIVGVLPQDCSRHNSPSHSWAITQICESNAQTGDWGIFVIPPRGHTNATAVAIAKAFPTFSMASAQTKRTISIQFQISLGNTELQNIQHLMEGVQFAANLVDRPANVFNVSNFIAEAEKVKMVCDLIFRNPGVSGFDVFSPEWYGILTC